MRFVSSFTDNEHGKALVELALVAPLLFAIAIPSIDAVNFARAGHLLNVVARESGRAGFSCAYLTTPQPDVERCLATNVNTALPATLDGVAANSAITISVWQHSVAGPVLRGQFRRGGLASRITAAQIGNLHSYTPEKGRIMVVETQVAVGPMTPFFRNERYLIMIM